MSPIPNACVLFNSIPTGFPEPGKTVVYDSSPTIDLDNVPLHGGFLLKTLVLSIDPYMRGRMYPEGTASYTTMYKLGKPMESHGVGVVLRSEMTGIVPGDHIYGIMPHQQYCIHTKFDGFSKIENKHNLPWSVFVGAAGMPGKTAFMAWQEYSKAKKGETVFVTTGAGPVGSLVIQIAKMQGLKVIASAGTDEKVRFMKDIGADVAFNYKTEDTRKVLKKEGPIHVYWDNVGGEALEAALDAATFHARFIECGMISGYNNGGAPVRNLLQMVTKSITMSGFIVFTLESKWEKDFQEFMMPRIASGEMKCQEEVTRGLHKVGDVIYAVQKGLNKGKAVIVVADE